MVKYTFNDKTVILKECDCENLNDILKLQDKTFASLKNPDILRKNTPEMFAECLRTPHYTLGMFADNELVALAILFFPGNGSENLSAEIEASTAESSANIKLIIVDEEYRGNGIQRTMTKLLEEYAKTQGVSLLCATVSPDNTHSHNNFIKCGYKIHCQITKYGGLKRNLFYKYI